jgi:hypothetical protein
LAATLHDLPVDDPTLVQVLQAQHNTGSIEHSSRLCEHIGMDVHHEVPTGCILHHKAHMCLHKNQRNEILASRYEHSILGYEAVQYGKQAATYDRKLLLLSPGQENGLTTDVARLSTLWQLSATLHSATVIFKTGLRHKKSKAIPVTGHGGL